MRKSDQQIISRLSCGSKPSRLGAALLTKSTSSNRGGGGFSGGETNATYQTETIDEVYNPSKEMIEIKKKLEFFENLDKLIFWGFNLKDEIFFVVSLLSSVV